MRYDISTLDTIINIVIKIIQLIQKEMEFKKFC